MVRPCRPHSLKKTAARRSLIRSDGGDQRIHHAGHSGHCEYVQGGMRELRVLVPFDEQGGQHGTDKRQVGKHGFMSSRKNGRPPPSGETGPNHGGRARILRFRANVFNAQPTNGSEIGQMAGKCCGEPTARRKSAPRNPTNGGHPVDSTGYLHSRGRGISHPRRAVPASDGSKTTGPEDRREGPCPRQTREVPRQACEIAARRVTQAG